MQGKGQGKWGERGKDRQFYDSRKQGEGRGRALIFDIFVASPLAFRHVIIDE